MLVLLLLLALSSVTAQAQTNVNATGIGSTLVLPPGASQLSPANFSSAVVRIAAASIISVPEGASLTVNSLIIRDARVSPDGSLSAGVSLLSKLLDFSVRGSLSLVNVTLETATCSGLAQLAQQVQASTSPYCSDVACQATYFQALGRVHIHEWREAQLSATNLVVQCSLGFCPSSSGAAAPGALFLQVSRSAEFQAACAAVEYVSWNTDCLATYSLNLSGIVQLDSSRWPAAGYYIDRNMTITGQGQNVTALDYQLRTEALILTNRALITISRLTNINLPPFWQPYVVAFPVWSFKFRRANQQFSQLSVHDCTTVVSDDEFQYYSYWAQLYTSFNASASAITRWMTHLGVQDIKIGGGDSNSILFTRFLATGLVSTNVTITTSSPLVAMLPGTRGLSEILDSWTDALPFAQTVSTQEELLRALQLPGSSRLQELMATYQFANGTEPVFLVTQNITLDRSKWPSEPVLVRGDKFTLMGSPFVDGPIMIDWSGGINYFALGPGVTMEVKDLYIRNGGYLQPFNASLDTHILNSMDARFWAWSLDNQTSNQVQMRRVTIATSPEEFQVVTTCIALNVAGYTEPPTVVLAPPPNPSRSPLPPPPPAVPSLTDLMTTLQVDTPTFLQITQRVAAARRDPWWVGACSDLRTLLPNTRVLNIAKLNTTAVNITNVRTPWVEAFLTVVAVDPTMSRPDLLPPAILPPPAPPSVPPAPGANNGTATFPPPAVDAGVIMDTRSGADSSNKTVVAVAVSVSIVCVLLLAALAVFLIRRRQRRAAHGQDKDKATGAGAKADSPAGSDAARPTASPPTMPGWVLGGRHPWNDNGDDNDDIETGKAAAAVSNRTRSADEVASSDVRLQLADFARASMSEPGAQGTVEDGARSPAGGPGPELAQARPSLGAPSVSDSGKSQAPMLGWLKGLSSQLLRRHSSQGSKDTTYWMHYNSSASAHRSRSLAPSSGQTQTRLSGNQTRVQAQLTPPAPALLPRPSHIPIITTTLPQRQSGNSIQNQVSVGKNRRQSSNKGAVADSPHITPTARAAGAGRDQGVGTASASQDDLTPSPVDARAAVALGGGVLAAAAQRVAAQREDGKRDGVLQPQNSTNARGLKALEVPTTAGSPGQPPAEQLMLQELHGISAKVKAGVKDDSLVLGDVLGSGAFSTVYKGQWQGLPVAVKSLVFSTHRRQMALKEAALSKSICHPHIVATYAFDLQPLSLASHNSNPSARIQVAHQSPDAQEWRLYIIQEYCDGGSLRKALDDGLLDPDAPRVLEGSGASASDSTPSAGVSAWTVGGDPASEYVGGEDTQGQAPPEKWPRINMRYALSLAMDIAQAMSHLHSKNIIHGDLKPENVLLSSKALSPAPSAVPSEGVSPRRGPPSGGLRQLVTSLAMYRAKVADFGLSIIMEDQQSHVSNLKVGTPFYLAPEVQNAGRVTTAADVFSFGVMCWELASGRPAWTKQKQPDGSGYSLKYHPMFPRLSPTIPVEYSRLMRACLSTSSHKRPRFDQILGVLTKLLNGGSLGNPLGGLDLARLGTADSLTSRTSRTQISSSPTTGTYLSAQGAASKTSHHSAESSVSRTRRTSSRSTGTGQLPRRTSASLSTVVDKEGDASPSSVSQLYHTPVASGYRVSGSSNSWMSHKGRSTSVTSAEVQSTQKARGKAARSVRRKRDSEDGDDEADSPPPARSRSVSQRLSHNSTMGQRLSHNSTMGQRLSQQSTLGQQLSHNSAIGQRASLPGRHSQPGVGPAPPSAWATQNTIPSSDGTLSSCTSSQLADVPDSASHASLPDTNMSVNLSPAGSVEVAVNPGTQHSSPTTPSPATLTKSTDRKVTVTSVVNASQMLSCGTPGSTTADDAGLLGPAAVPLAPVLVRKPARRPRAVEPDSDSDLTLPGTADAGMVYGIPSRGGAASLAAPVMHLLPDGFETGPDSQVSSALTTPHQGAGLVRYSFPTAEKYLVIGQGLPDTTTDADADRMSDSSSTTDVSTLGSSVCANASSRAPTPPQSDQQVLSPSPSDEAAVAPVGTPEQPSTVSQGAASAAATAVPPAGHSSRSVALPAATAAANPQAGSSQVQVKPASAMAASSTHTTAAAIPSLGPTALSAEGVVSPPPLQWPPTSRRSSAAPIRGCITKPLCGTTLGVPGMAQPGAQAATTRELPLGLGMAPPGSRAPADAALDAGGLLASVGHSATRLPGAAASSLLLPGGDARTSLDGTSGASAATDGVAGDPAVLGGAGLASGAGVTAWRRPAAQRVNVAQSTTAASRRLAMHHVAQAAQFMGTGRGTASTAHRLGGSRMMPSALAPVQELDGAEDAARANQAGDGGEGVGGDAQAQSVPDTGSVQGSDSTFAESKVPTALRGSLQKMKAAMAGFKGPKLRIFQSLLKGNGAHIKGAQQLLGTDGHVAKPVSRSLYAATPSTVVKEGDPVAEPQPSLARTSYPPQAAPSPITAMLTVPRTTHQSNYPSQPMAVSALLQPSHSAPHKRGSHYVRGRHCRLPPASAVMAALRAVQPTLIKDDVMAKSMGVGLPHSMQHPLPAAPALPGAASMQTPAPAAAQPSTRPAPTPWSTAMATFDAWVAATGGVPLIKHRGTRGKHIGGGGSRHKLQGSAHRYMLVGAHTPTHLLPLNTATADAAALGTCVSVPVSMARAVGPSFRVSGSGSVGPGSNPEADGPADPRVTTALTASASFLDSAAREPSEAGGARHSQDGYMGEGPPSRGSTCSPPMPAVVRPPGSRVPSSNSRLPSWFRAQPQDSLMAAQPAVHGCVLLHLMLMGSERADGTTSAPTSRCDLLLPTDATGRLIPEQLMPLPRQDGAGSVASTADVCWVGSSSRTASNAGGVVMSYGDKDLVGEREHTAEELLSGLASFLEAAPRKVPAAAAAMAAASRRSLDMDRHPLASATPATNVPAGSLGSHCANVLPGMASVASEADGGPLQPLPPGFRRSSSHPLSPARSQLSAPSPPPLQPSLPAVLPVMGVALPAVWDAVAEAVVLQARGSSTGLDSTTALSPPAHPQLSQAWLGAKGRQNWSDHGTAARGVEGTVATADGMACPQSGATDSTGTEGSQGSSCEALLDSSEDVSALADVLSLSVADMRHDPLEGEDVIVTTPVALPH